MHPFTSTTATIEASPSYSAFTKSSQVWQGRDTSIRVGGDKEVAQFDLWPGNWILIAKAEIRSGGPFTLDVQLILSVKEGSRTDEDRSKARVTSFGYQTPSLILGTSVVTSGDVRLTVQAQGASGDDVEGTAQLDHIVISAIKVDRILVGKL